MLEKPIISKPRRGRPRKVAVPPDEKSPPPLKPKGASRRIPNGDIPQPTRERRVEDIRDVDSLQSITKPRRGRPRKNPLPPPDLGVTLDTLGHGLPEADTPGAVRVVGQVGDLLRVGNDTPFGTSPESQSVEEESQIQSHAVAPASPSESLTSTSKVTVRENMDLDLREFEADEAELQEEEEEEEEQDAGEDVEGGGEQRNEAEREEALQDEEQAEIQVHMVV